jgi:hypothetical protein
MCPKAFNFDFRCLIARFELSRFFDKNFQDVTAEKIDSKKDLWTNISEGIHSEGRAIEDLGRD